MENKEILLGKGLGAIVFGATAGDVKTLLGKADEVEVNGEEDEAVDELWHYDALDCSLGFDDEARLITISVTSNDYKLEGKSFIGLSKIVLLEELKKINISDLEEEDCDDEGQGSHIIIYSESKGLNCWLENGFVTELQWDVLLDGDGYVQWA